MNAFIGWLLWHPPFLAMFGGGFVLFAALFGGLIGHLAGNLIFKEKENNI